LQKEASIGGASFFALKEKPASGASLRGSEAG
jgi:hypothetical protein